MDAKAGRRLVRAIDAIVASGCELNEPHYKRVPRGLDPRHSRAEWLRHRALHASWEQSPAPTEMFGPEALDFCLERFRAMRPVQKWLVDSL